MLTFRAQNSVASAADIQIVLFETARFLVMVSVSLFLAYIVFMVTAIAVSTLRSMVRREPSERGSALPYRGAHRSRASAHA